MTTKTWEETYGDGAKNAETTQMPLTALEIEKLEGMSLEELITLIKRVSGAIWGYALMDDIEKAEAARLKLYNIGMNETEVSKVVPALDKWFDRTIGKAPQAITMDATVKTVNFTGIIRFTDDPPLIDNDLKTIEHNIE